MKKLTFEFEISSEQNINSFIDNFVLYYFADEGYTYRKRYHSFANLVRQKSMFDRMIIETESQLRSDLN